MTDLPLIAALTTPPPWWNGHDLTWTAIRRGTTLKLTAEGRVLEISAIGRSGSFRLCYTIEHGNGTTAHQISGLPAVRIEKMFALRRGSPSDWRIFPGIGIVADAGERGEFCRTKGYLNIPHPGIGHPGDPNLSLLITEDIRKAVEDFLAWVP
ncbi:MAG TPA: hypothetical protein VGB97_03495 [Candidatus Paceibacterota bacterium]|jgi:hypothetical protein